MPVNNGVGRRGRVAAIRECGRAIRQQHRFGAPVRARSREVVEL
jgi:hypothetical protein